MLSLALAATLVGFALLVVALTTSNLLLAIACVVVCLIGLILLLVDTLRSNRRGSDGEDEEPLFTIRGRESAARAEPLDDDGVPLEDDPARIDDHDAPSWDEPDAPRSSGLASLVQPASERGVEEVDQPPSGGSAPISGGFAPMSGGFTPPSAGFAASGPGDVYPGGADPDESSGGDLNDYLRATGSFPAPRAQDPRAQNPPTQNLPPQTGPHRTGPQQPRPPQTGPHQTGPHQRPGMRSSSPDLPAGADPSVSDPSASDPSASDPLGSDSYVGRRRLGDDIVVRSPDSDLPAMQFVWEDPEEKPKGDHPGGVK